MVFSSIVTRGVPVSKFQDSGRPQLLLAGRLEPLRVIVAPMPLKLVTPTPTLANFSIDRGADAGGIRHVSICSKLTSKLIWVPLANWWSKFSVWLVELAAFHCAWVKVWVKLRWPFGDRDGLVLADAAGDLHRERAERARRLALEAGDRDVADATIGLGIGNVGRVGGIWPIALDRDDVVVCRHHVGDGGAGDARDRVGRALGGGGGVEPQDRCRSPGSCRCSWRPGPAC
jgi:hypothetical protein